MEHVTSFRNLPRYHPTPGRPRYPFRWRASRCARDHYFHQYFVYFSGAATDPARSPPDARCQPFIRGVCAQRRQWPPADHFGTPGATRRPADPCGNLAVTLGRPWDDRNAACSKNFKILYARPGLQFDPVPALGRAPERFPDVGATLVQPYQSWPAMTDGTARVKMAAPGRGWCWEGRGMARPAADLTATTKSLRPWFSPPARRAPKGHRDPGCRKSGLYGRLRKQNETNWSGAPKKRDVHPGARSLYARFMSGLRTVYFRSTLGTLAGMKKATPDQRRASPGAAEDERYMPIFGRRHLHAWSRRRQASLSLRLPQTRGARLL